MIPVNNEYRRGEGFMTDQNTQRVGILIYLLPGMVVGPQIPTAILFVVKFHKYPIHD